VAGNGPAAGDGTKKRTRRGQRKRKAASGSRLGDAPIGGSTLLAPVVAPPTFDLARPVCFIGRCGRIDRAEVELRRTLIVGVIGQEGSGCAAEVRDAIASRFCLEADTLRLRHVAPNSFLVFFPSVSLVDRVVDRGQSLHVPPLRLHVRRWSHQAFASGSGQSLVPLDIELCGIHARLWGIETAEALVGAYCLIHGLLSYSVSGDDLSVLRLRVWCRSPEHLPAVLDLHAEESAVIGEDGNWLPRTLVFPVSELVLRSGRVPGLGLDNPSPSPLDFADKDRDHDQHERRPRQLDHPTSSTRASVHLRLDPRIQSEPSHDGQVDVIPLQFVHVVELVAPMSPYLVEVGPIDASAIPVTSIEELEAPGHPPDLALGLTVDLGENFQCDVSLPGDLFPSKLSSGDLVAVVQEAVLEDVISTGQNGSGNCMVRDSSSQLEAGVISNVCSVKPRKH
jgi:hypothetical protein